RRVHEAGDVFFFQAEDGIRDYKVTGVQTCALPISAATRPAAGDGRREGRGRGTPGSVRPPQTRGRSRRTTRRTGRGRRGGRGPRSEERRVGKECRTVGRR